MAAVADPSFFSDEWNGTPSDDVLIYRGGNDGIAGLNGFDVLVIPYDYFDCIVGNFSGLSVNIQTPDALTGGVAVTTAIQIEAIQFNDFLDVLEVDTTRPVFDIYWGTGGYWTTNKRLGQREGWTTKGGRTTKYLIDNDYEVFTREDIGDLPLRLNGGSWDNTVYESGFGGTFVRSGRNVIALFEGISVEELWTYEIIDG